MLRSIRANKSEKKNGWDNTSLQAYISERERNAAQIVLSGPKREKGPRIENCHSYSPHGWGKRR
jgi:hypothetical protein